MSQTQNKQINNEQIVNKHTTHNANIKKIKTIRKKSNKQSVNKQ